MKNKNPNNPKNSELGFLLELKKYGGKNLYNCINDAINLYKDGHYKSVMNAARMFYECFVICFFNGVENCIKDSYGNPDTRETVKQYFENGRVTGDDEKFYKEIFKEDWRIVNRGSHYLSRLDYSAAEIKNEAEYLLCNMITVSEYFYSKKTGKPRNTTVDLEKLLQANSNDCLTDMLEADNESLRNELRIIKDEMSDYKNKEQLLRRELTQKDNVLHAIKNKERLLEIKLEEVNDKILGYVQEIKSLKMRLSAYQNTNKIQHDDSKNNALQKEIESLQSEIWGLKRGEIGKLKADIRLKHERLLSLNEEKEKLSQKCKALVNKNNSLEIEINRINAALVAAKRQNPQIHNNVSNSGVHGDIRVDNLANDVLSIIKYMNKLKCYATISTIANVFKGVDNTPQITYFPDLKKCLLFGTKKNISCCEIDKCVNQLVTEKKIRKSGGIYIANK